ncbi:hypothetical protein ACWGL3_23630, partial [Nocardiopsis sp. NPDC055824]
QFSHDEHEQAAHRVVGVADVQDHLAAGTWLTVREYWASDPGTGAVGVAFHRLTGMRSGAKPTGPEFDVGTGDEIAEEERRW